MATGNVTNSSGANPSVQALLDSVNTRQTKESAGGISDVQDRFLKLLTTQLKNQDPLNPLDNAQVTSQLAQISTVSGIEKLSATLQLLLQANADAQTTQAAALVGHSILVEGNGLELSNGIAAGGVELTGPADQVTVTIKDANGLVIKTLSLGAMDPGIHNFGWDGKAEDGTPAVDGKYSISVEAKRGEDVVTAKALEFGLVRSVIRNGQEFSLDAGTLGAFTLADVKQIL